MSFDRRGIDQHPRRRTACRRQGPEDVRPNAFRRPAHEAIVECLAWSIDRRRIDPAAAGFEHMDDPADDPPVVHTRLAPRVSRKKRFKPRELLLAQPETISIHEWSPFGDLESRNAPIGNPLYGSGA